MNKNIITADQLPKDEKIYFKKDWAGYRIVHPIKNEDGSTNWPNLLFGGKRNLLFIIIVLILMAFALFAYNNDIAQYRDIVENPCDYCNPAESFTGGLDLSNITLNWREDGS